MPIVGTCFLRSNSDTSRSSSVIHLFGRLAPSAVLMQQFEAGEAPVLVCSDAMARGMDLRCVDYVVSYDAPAFIKTYIHRYEDCVNTFSLWAW